MINVRVLGTAEIEVGGKTITPASARKFSLLLYLAAQAGRRVPRVSLHELIYPDQSAKNARHSLREMVYQLRRLGVTLEATPDAIRIDEGLVRFDSAAITGEGPIDPALLLHLENGLLPGYAPDHSEAFTEWLEGHRATTSGALASKLVNAIHPAKVAGDWRTCERLARACLALEPLNEEATLTMAEVAAMSGSKVRAVELLDGFVRDLYGKPAELRMQAEILKRRINERLATLVYPKRQRFVGRAEEMRILDGFLRAVRDKATRCISIQGVAGVGKSRLASEFAAKSALAGCRVVRVAVQPIDREHPMSAFMSLIPQVLDLPGAIGCSPDSLALLNRLTRHDPDGGMEGLTVAAGSSDLIAGRLYRAIVDVLAAVTAETPLIAVVDDAQWLDDVSLRTIRHIATSGDAGRLLIIVTARTEVSRALIAEPGVNITSLSLGPLSGDASGQLVRDALEEIHISDDSLGTWICDVAAGNPFFIECLIAHFSRTSERFSIPREINDLVDQRIEVLSPNAAQTLFTTAALGRYATTSRLIDVAELPTHALLQAVQELELGRLIHAGDVVEVSHWLIADAVERRATPIMRQIIHERIATVLQRDAEISQDAGVLWACAEHWALAGRRQKACETFRACAAHSIEIGRAREAAELLLRAAALAEIGERSALVEQAIETASFASEGDLVLRSMPLLGRSIEQMPHDVVELALLSAAALNECGDDQTIERLRNCVATSSAAADHRLQAGLTLLIWSDQNLRVDVAEYAHQTLRYTIDHELASGSHLALLFRTIYNSCFGDAAEGVRCARMLLARGSGAGGAARADIMRKAGSCLWRSGRAFEAIDAYETALVEAERCGSHRVAFGLSLVLAACYEDIGEDRSADTWLERVNALRGLAAASSLDFSYAVVVAERALAAHDDDRLRLIRAQVSTDAFSSHARGRRWLRAMDLYLRALDGHAIDWPAEIESTFADLAAGSAVGDLSDFEIAVIGISLSRDDCGDHAGNLVQRYLQSFRRGHTPLSRPLRDLVIRLRLPELPQWVVLDWAQDARP